MMLGEAYAHAILPATDLDRAREFWKGLGLREVLFEEGTQEVVFEAGAGTQLVVYRRSEPTKAEHTVLGFEVDDLDRMMSDLRSHGVTFEEYDMPELKTRGGVAEMDEGRAAWFKDSEGNIINIAEDVRTRNMAGAAAARGWGARGGGGM